MNDQCVQILVCDLDRIIIPKGEVTETLSKEELVRARRFRSSELARRFRTGRYMLRKVLEARIGLPARDIHFAVGEHGKPYLPGGPSFNLSHSQSIALIGLVAEGEFGLDVEHVVANRELDRIAERFFAIEERESLMCLSEGERWNAFYRIWTKKESLLKALGKGMSEPLDSFAVPIGTHGGSVVLRDSGDGNLKAWYLQSLDIGRNCEAAIAWDRRPSRIEVRPLAARGGILDPIFPAA